MTSCDEVTSSEVLQNVQVMHSGCKQCTVGASNAMHSGASNAMHSGPSNATHSGRKQCNSQWAQAMQRTVDASNATHSGRKQCNAQWEQAMQCTVGASNDDGGYSKSTDVYYWHKLCKTSASRLSRIFLNTPPLAPTAPHP